MIIRTNGIELFCEKSGCGAPLLLLHGNGEDHHIFDPIADKLRHGFTVYALDSRNHGQSSKTGDYAYDSMAADVYSFIRTLNLGKVNIIGFSDGAIIALILAMTHGEVISRMALLGANLKPADFTAESHQYIQDLYEKTGDPLVGLMLEQPDIELEALRSIPVPTFLIAGEHDIYRPGLYHEMMAALPDARLKIMTGHGHDSYIVNQAMLYPDLLDFFADGNAAA